MKVEIISVSSRLLTSELPDVHSKHAANVVRALDFDLTCRVLVGEELELVVDVIQAGLQRADVVLLIGNVSLVEGILLPAVARATALSLTPNAPGIAGATLLGSDGDSRFGVFVRDERGLVFCLPDERRELDAILEGSVLPLMHEEVKRKRAACMTLLRTAGVNKSSLEQELNTLRLTPEESITYATYAGLTDIRLRAEADTKEEAEQILAHLVRVVQERLGDEIYGRDGDRLEDVILGQLRSAGISLLLAECNGLRQIGTRWNEATAGEEPRLSIMPLPETEALTALLDELQTEDSSNLVEMVKRIAEQLRQSHQTDLMLLVYNNVNQGGVRVVVSLAAPNGVVPLERSFGGHPENIEEWSATLGLVLLRRWIQKHGRHHGRPAA